MANLEWTAVKTTIDKLVHDLASAVPGTPLLVGLVDDSANFEEVLGNTKPALLYQVARLSGRAPKFDLTFNVGAKTTDDASNFLITKVVEAMNDKFYTGAWYALHDYSGAVASEKLGAMTLVEANVMPSQFDKQSNIRMMSCQAKVLCRGS